MSQIDGIKIIIYSEGKEHEMFEAHRKDYLDFNIEIEQGRPCEHQHFLGSLEAYVIPTGHIDFSLKFSGMSKKQLKIRDEAMDKELSKRNLLLKGDHDTKN